MSDNYGEGPQDIALGHQYPAKAESRLRAELDRSTEVAQTRKNGHNSTSRSVEYNKQASEAHTDAADRRASGRLVSFLLLVWSQWFMILFGCVILVSYLVPNVARRGGYLAAEYSISYGALAIIFLVAGLTMPSKLIWTNLGNWRVHLVTQSMCFIITPLIGLAVVECVIASGNEKITPLVLTGIIIMVCTPTTVASNITFTRISGGDDATALVEVTIGNLIGIFISPALVQLFLRPSLGLGTGAPTQGVGQIYAELIKHFGLALYLPLFVGQIVRNIWTEKVDKVSKLLYLPKWASICLLLLVWETFSNSFASHAFSAIPTESIILIVFLNIGLYPFFTLLCFLACRPPGRFFNYRINRKQTTAACFCGPPKSITVGIVLISIQYSNFSALDEAIISIPLSLYQGIQIFVAQGFVVFFSRYNRVADD